MSKWIEKIPVDSDSSDLTYIVGIAATGEYGCSCPHWKFRRQSCKHIERVKAQRLAAVFSKLPPKKAKAEPTTMPDFTARPRRMIQLEDD
jgi:hypothetical protein